jgi:hypothetical protein
LQQLLNSPNLNPLEISMIQKALMERQRMASNPQTGEMMSRSGIGSISTGDMVPDEMTMAANGGIIAFAGGGFKKPEGYDERRKKLEEQQAEFLKAMQDEKAWEKTNAAQARYDKDIASAESSLPWRAVTAAGLAGLRGNPEASQRGNFLSNLGYMGEAGMGEYSKGLGEIARDKKLSLQQGVEAEKAKFARNAQLYSALTGTIGQMDTRELTANQVAATREATAVKKSGDDLIKAQNTWNDALKDAKKDLRDRNKFSSVYRKNPEQFDIDAEAAAKRNVSPDVLKILGLKPATAEAPAATATPGAAKPAKALDSSKLPKITTQDAYDKLKSGQQYVDPDGNVRTKK